MSTYINFLMYCLLNISPIKAPPEFNILDYGAVGDSATLNTWAIQQAVDACHKAGGGLVTIPQGVFLTGSVELKSGVYLYVSVGGTLRGSSSLSDYPIHRCSHPFGQEGLEIRSLVWADGQKNTGILGNGEIDGNGHSQAFSLTQQPRPLRPIVLRFVACEHVKIRDITLKNSPMWMQQYVACKDLEIGNIQVHNFSNRNNDGLDIAGCQNVVVSGCRIRADDDGICLKTLSSSPNENILITDCLVSSNCNAIKIGTETMADHRNIIISNCIVSKSGVFSDIWKRDIGVSGIALETVDGGTLDNILITNVIVSGVYTPLFVRLGKRGRRFKESDPEPGVGKIKNIVISNFSGKSERPPECVISGIPGHSIENVSLKNISLSMPGGSGGEDLLGRQIPEKEKSYPEVLMFGLRLPAYGLYLRHVKNLKINDLLITYEQEDTRPALHLDDVEEAEIAGFKAEVSLQSKAAIRAIGCSDLWIHSSHTGNAKSFVWLQGSNTDNILLSNLKKSHHDQVVFLADSSVQNKSLSVKE